MSNVSVNTLVAGLVSLTTVAIAAVVILTGLGRGNEALVAVILGFVGTNVTALMSLYHSAKTREEIKNGALQKPVQRAVEQAFSEPNSVLTEPVRHAVEEALDNEGTHR